MPIPESVEHKIKDIRVREGAFMVRKTICLPDCPQCLNERWANEILQWTDEYGRVQYHFSAKGLESLKDMAGGE